MPKVRVIVSCGNSLMKPPRGMQDPTAIFSPVECVKPDQKDSNTTIEIRLSQGTRRHFLLEPFRRDQWILCEHEAYLWP